MTMTALCKLAAAHSGNISATWKEMLLFGFEREPDAEHFANTTGGMLIRGLVLSHGVVSVPRYHVGVVPQEG